MFSFPFCRLRSYRPLLAAISLVALLLFGANDASATCRVAPGWVPRVINIDMGAVAVRPDLAIGEVIQRRRFSIPVNGAKQAIFYCDTENAEDASRYTRAELKMGTLNYAGCVQDAFTTNLTGIAYRIRLG